MNLFLYNQVGVSEDSVNIHSSFNLQSEESTAIATCLSLASLAHRVDLVALLAVTLVAARQVDADLAAGVRRGAFIDVCK